MSIYTLEKSVLLQNYQLRIKERFVILTGFSYGQICMSSFSEPKVALVKDPLYLLNKISLVEHPYLTNI